MKFLPILIRFSLYGFCTFAAFGYLLQNPYVNNMASSHELMLGLGVMGAVSFLVSAGAVLVLRGVFKELISNDSE